jgi:hypothetical protein
LKSIDARSASELPVAPEGEEHRTGLSKEAIKRAFLDNLFYVQGKFPALASRSAGSAPPRPTPFRGRGRWRICPLNF